MSTRFPDWRQIESENRTPSVRSVRFLGEGWNSRAYLVNDELVFRFPKHRAHWEELNREIAFLAFAADRLPLAAPRYLQVIPESRGAPHGYAVYRYLPGERLEVQALAAAKRDEAADRIAAFLRALHALRPEPALAALLPQDDAQATAEENRARAERDLGPQLTRTEIHALRRAIDTYFGTPDCFAFHPVVLHADMSGDHLVERGGDVVGVLDFGDVNRGDADFDFLYLFLDFGAAFAHDVANRYGHPHPDQLEAKLRYYALIDQIDTILEDEGRASPDQRDAAWRRLKQLLA
jgi:aminoglycoside 2''-phosphotransferase